MLISSRQIRAMTASYHANLHLELLRAFDKALEAVGAMNRVVDRDIELVSVHRRVSLVRRPRIHRKKM